MGSLLAREAAPAPPALSAGSRTGRVLTLLDRRAFLGLDAQHKSALWWENAGTLKLLRQLDGWCSTRPVARVPPPPVPGCVGHRERG